MCVVRTTVSIDDELLVAARRRGETLGQVVEAALRRELTGGGDHGPDQQAPIPVFTGGTGPRPGIDLDANRALIEVLDEGLELDQRR